MLDFINGKKTYIVAVLFGMNAAANMLGYQVPDFVYDILAALGLGAVRSAIGKSTPSA